MKPFRPVVPVFVGLTLLLVSCRSSSPELAHERVDVTGTWSGTVITTSAFDITLDLTQAGSSVSGEYSEGGGPVLVSGTVTGDVLAVFGVDAVNDASLLLTGEVDGDAITGIAEAKAHDDLSQIRGTFSVVRDQK